MIEIKRLLKFMLQHDLTQSQVLFLTAIREAKDEEVHELLKEYKIRFPSEDGTLIGQELKLDLIDRGYIIVKGNGRTLLDYELTDKFLDLYIGKVEAGDEFWEKYPATITSKGVDYPMKLMDKHKFYDIYWNLIKQSREEHRQVMLDLEYAIENSLLRGKLETFVTSAQWTEVRKIRLNHDFYAGQHGQFEDEDF